MQLLFIIQCYCDSDIANKGIDARGKMSVPLLCNKTSGGRRAWIVLLCYWTYCPKAICPLFLLEMSTKNPDARYAHFNPLG